MKNGEWFEVIGPRMSRAVAGALLSLSAIACHTGRVAVADPAAAPRVEWSSTLTQASAEASASRYAAADRALSDYATRYPASAGAVESIYWRALYRLDPANPAASGRDASALLESYLSSPAAEHRAEAASLRRLAQTLESRGGSTLAGATVDGSKAADRGKDEELARVKDELAKANAELERIRRRLAQPKP